MSEIKQQALPIQIRHDIANRLVQLFKSEGRKIPTINSMVRIMSSGLSKFLFQPRLDLLPIKLHLPFANSVQRAERFALSYHCPTAQDTVGL